MAPDTPWTYIHGKQIFLGWRPPDPAVRAALPRFGDAYPKMPRSEWREISRRNDPLNFITNQRSHGSCVGFSSAAQLSRAFRFSGRTATPILSGSYVYSFINGGQDRGAIIHEALAVLRDEGSCPETLNDWDHIYPHQISPEARAAAKRFRGFEFYTAGDFDDIMTAVQLGFFPIHAVMVGNNFAHVNAEGVAGFDRGPGNHAVGVDGAKKLSSGEWVLDNPNTWGTEILQGGRCYFTEKHIASVQQDAYVIRCVLDDPQDPDPPPAAQ